MKSLVHIELFVIIVIAITGAGCSSSDSLFRAASDNDIEQVRSLLAKGENVNAVDSEGRTPLHLAAESGSQTLLEILIENGADVNARDAEGSTPLDVAIDTGAPYFTDVLVASGADFGNTDVNAINESGNTPLHVAAMEGFPKLTELLLSSGAQASVNVKNMEGLTPLHYAVTRSASVTRQLIDTGADVTATREPQENGVSGDYFDYSSDTPLNRALETYRDIWVDDFPSIAEDELIEVIRLLIKNGA